MDKRIQMSILLDIYGVLLTEKQRDIMDLYFNNDLSLAELSENTKTSRQANHDLIKRCEKLLLGYEAKLCLMTKDTELQNIKKLIDKDLNILVETYRDTESKDVITDIRNLINDLN
ncbi:MAG: putative DNA-binding protein [Clostridium sp.]